MAEIYEHQVVLHTLLRASSQQYAAAVEQDAGVHLRHTLQNGAKRKYNSAMNWHEGDELDDSEDEDSVDEGVRPDRPAAKLLAALRAEESSTPASSRAGPSAGPLAGPSSDVVADGREEEQIRPRWAHVTPMKLPDGLNGAVNGGSAESREGGQPIKRARGRPRKSTLGPAPQLGEGTEVGPSNVSSGSLEGVVIAVPAKCGPGHPRKSAAPPATNDGEERAEDGNPRELDSAVHASPAVEEGDIAVQPPKGGPGRPRKSLPPPLPAEVHALPLPRSTWGLAGPPGNGEAAPAKRKPGRPRKSAPPAAAPSPRQDGAGADGEMPGPSGSAAGIVAGTPKRGPGRPRKSLPPPLPGSSADGPSMGVPVQGVAVSGEAVTPKRGPGRPRKSAPPLPGSAVAGSSAPPLPALVATNGEAVTPKRGPGRPRKSLPPPLPGSSAGGPTTGQPVPAVAANGAAITPKRRPGRPRKSDLQPAAESSQPSSSGPVNGHVAGPPGEVVTPKHKRGLPRKVVPDQLASDGNANAGPSTINNVSPSDASPVKPASGTPRKSILSQALDLFRPSQTVREEVGSEQNIADGHADRREAQPLVGVVVDGVPSASSQDIGDDGEVATPKKRGWSARFWG